MLDLKRQGEIGRVVFKQLIKKRGIMVSGEFEREIGNEVKLFNETEPDLHITTAELAEMYLQLAQELMDVFELRIRSKSNNAR